MRAPRRARRSVLATVGAAALVLGIGGIGTAGGGDNANGTVGTRLPGIVSTLVAGTQKQFTPVAPCRIIDTRVAGGAVGTTARTFTSVGPYAAQGGNAAGCGIPATVVAVLVNLGGITANGATGYLTGWATGTPAPLASLVNYPKTGPIANMVAIPVNATGQFSVRSSGSAHVFADVAGYYTSPLYVAVRPEGTIYTPSGSGVPIASGVVAITHPATGQYTVQFNRPVVTCSATGTDLIFAGTRDVSADVTYSANGGGDSSIVTVRVTNSSDTLEDTFFSLSLTC